MKQQTDPIISIIVPVYQVAPYLRECLDSIVEQSFTDWEMILIDDGSTDGGEQICDEYGAKDDRIRVFHRENKGLSSALNFGLDTSLGEYIAMVDADDVLLSRDYIRILYDAIENNDAEISVCRRIVFSDESPAPEPVVGLFNNTILSGKDVFTAEPYCFDARELSLSCSKLYRKSCFEGIRYPVGRIMEDLAVFHRLVYPCSRIVLLEDGMYGRRIRPGSIIAGSKAASHYEDVLFAIDDRIAYFEGNNDQNAISYAIRSKKLSKYNYYFESLKDGSLDDIPPKIRPKVPDFENELDCMQLLRAFRKADPKYHDPHTIEYLSTLSSRALKLLRISCSYLLRKSTVPGTSPSEYDLLSKLAVNEGLFETVSAATCRQDDDHTIRIVRPHILMQHAVNALSDSSAVDAGRPAIIPLIPSDILALYTEPWLRCSGPRSLLADSTEMDRIELLMERQGFVRVSSDPLEKERLHSISFKNNDNTRLDMVFEYPPNMSSACRDYLGALFRELVRDRREMTVVEYALYLVLKLHIPNMYALSARLCDLLDLTLILHSYPESIQDKQFLEKIKELGLGKDWNLLRSICEKAMDPPDTQTTLQPKELHYLSSLIGMPYLRADYLEDLSRSLLEYDRFLEPAEYVVSRENDLAYLINPKTACSSIMSSVLDIEVADDDSIHRIANDLGVKKNELKGDEKSFFKFTFVRNPFTRLVSCYENKFRSDIKRYGDNILFRDYLGGYLYNVDDFSEFVRKVCALPYRLMDRHFCLQYHTVFDNDGECRCDYVGRFETLGDDFDAIQKKYRLHPLPFLNSTGTNDWMDYYTTETATLVYDTFKKDIETFGYAEDYNRLMRYLKSNSVSTSLPV